MSKFATGSFDEAAENELKAALAASTNKDRLPQLPKGEWAVCVRSIANGKKDKTSTIVEAIPFADWKEGDDQIEGAQYAIYGLPFGATADTLKRIITNATAFKVKATVGETITLRDDDGKIRMTKDERGKDVPMTFTPLELGISKL